MSRSPSILVIDDEESICLAFQRFFERRQWSVRFASSKARGLAALREHPADVVFLDVRLPDGNGLDLLDILRTETPDCRVIVITAYGSLNIVIQAVRNKAFDYLVKPLDLDKALLLAQRAIETRSASAARTETPAVDENELVGISPAMQAVYKQLAMIAQGDTDVLIQGQTGTGKELVARAIHRCSARRDNLFVAVNCAALPENLVESELFGHVRGAFTGADADRIGRFQSADGGTLFLDEIAEMPPSVQVKLLRVLDDRVIEQVGSTSPIRLDVRVLAATNRNLLKEVKAQRFRSDLYYRLAVSPIELPPLARRGEDIVLLANHFLTLAARGKAGGAAKLSPEALDLLRGYPWPGNVRELRNAVEHAAAVAGGDFLRPEHLPESLRNPACSAEGFAKQVREYIESLPAGAKGMYHAVIESAERELILHALRTCRGNQSEAAELLGLHRNTLRNRIHDLGIEACEQ